MSGEYKGFRIWNLEFQVMTPGASNVVDDGNGRMHNSVTNAIYWDETDDGLRSHLLDFLNPMIDSSTNGVGWELDEEAYNKFYNIVQNNDPAYSAFITRNSNIWDAKNNPTGDKTIKLVPTSFVRVMCFKHILGYRAMIGLSLYAMDAFNAIDQYMESTSYSSKIDPGFNKYHVYRTPKTKHPSSRYWAIGGLFMTMIPPENNSDIPSGMWNLEQNVYDEAFFPPTMTQVIPMIYGSHSWNKNSSGSYTINYEANYACCSWLKRGTSTTYSAGQNAGMLNGTNCKLSLMLDSKANVCMSYKYVSDQNTKYVNPMIWLGPIYKKKIYNDDTLCTKNLGILCSSITGTLGDKSESDTGAYEYFSAWCTGSSYYNYYNNWTYNNSYAALHLVGTLSSDASTTDVYNLYTAYPACPSTVFTNFRYAKAAYTERGLIDEEVFRWVSPEGLVKGQTYNDNQWIYLGSEYNFYAEDTYNGTRTYLYPSMRWDGEFNGTKTFA